MNRMNTTRFMTQEEFMAQLTEIDLRSSEVYEAGGVPLLVKNQKAYVDTSDSHTIIFGATGSKKTRLLGMPSVEILSRAGESFVVTDPKGEIYEKTVMSVQKRGYKVQCINLRDFKKGVAWNPLILPYDCYHRGEKSKAVEMVSEIGKMIVGEGLEDPFWTTTAADVVTGLMLILLECADREECNIKSMLFLWEQYLSNREEMMRLIVKRFSGTLICRKLRSLDNESGKTVGSIEAVVATGLNRLSANEEFVDFLSQEGMEFDDVTKGKNAIYLIIPDENKFYHFIASLFMEQLYEVLIKEAQRSPGLQLGVRMNYVVDEFANIPKMENMDSMITAARSRNIRFHLIVQSKMQLEEKYGATSSVICDNCNNWVYLYSKDLGLLKEISSLCGNVIYDNHMSMPLISEFELQHLKKEDGEALVLAGRNYPCIVNLEDIDAYPAVHNRGEIAEVVQTQLWSEPSVFVLAEEKEASVYKYIPSRRERNRNRMGTKPRQDIWLVGTCDGMILAEELVSRDELDSGIGMIRICLGAFDKVKELSNLIWYYSTSEALNEYAMQLYKEPYKIYLTIDEVGTGFFTPVPKEVINKLEGAGLC